jgi:hypothetical protein
MTSRQARLSKLERLTEEAETLRLAEQFAAEFRLPLARVLEEARVSRARIRADKVLYPEEWIPDADGLIDLEPYIRRLAVEHGLDPDELLQDADRLCAEEVARP